MDNNKIFNGKFILVIEDSPFDQMVMKNALSKHGCIIQTAGDGITALDKIRMEKFDLIFTDMYLPKLSGMEVAQKIRNTDNPNRQTPIIAITGEEYEEAMIDIIKASGVDKYLMKPVHERELLEIITFLLNNQNTLGNRKSSTTTGYNPVV